MNPETNLTKTIFAGAIAQLLMYAWRKFDPSVDESLTQAMSIIVLGLLVYVIPHSPSDSTSSSSAKPLAAIPLVFLLSAALMSSSGCSTLGLGDIPAPQTPAQHVFELQSEYNDALTAALAYMKSPAARPEVVKALREADQRAYQAIAVANYLAAQPVSTDRDRNLELYSDIITAACAEIQKHIAAEKKPVEMGIDINTVLLLLLQLLSLMQAGMRWLPEHRARADALRSKIKQFIDEDRDPTPEELAALMADTDELHAQIQALDGPATPVE